ncbi:ubiquinol-cytochrome C chaperone family protein [Caulobacter sp. KR2-114]|uniref:ubiquinol-cytochrome C chaperone family protein n=1 Tax=Caulobacter sp. KR2-114 TaxID=3400912 RepID=UPI003C015825
MVTLFDRLLAKGPVKTAARRLHESAVAQGRLPELYLDLGAPDTVEGRFEMLTLHVILLIDRLKDEPDAAGVRQALFDTYVRDLDGALREMGVGDLSVGKKMRKLGEAFYGRAKAYDAAFRALPDTAPLADVASRTALGGADGAPLAGYIRAVRETLAAQPTAALADGDVIWPGA